MPWQEQQYWEKIYTYHYIDSTQRRVDEARLKKDFNNDDNQLLKKFFDTLIKETSIGKKIIPTGCIDVKMSSIKDANVFDMKNYVYYPDNAYCCNLCLANVFHHVEKKTAANLFKKSIGIDPCDVFVGDLNEKEKTN